jgi:RHS repeat-associated protein
MGGGVGGINYAEYADGSELNYKFYNLRGDVILTLDNLNNVKSKSIYTAFGTHDDTGTIATDSHRANTKVEDADRLLNEGRRFRSLDYGVFLTPDPLEYVDGLNSCIYVNQNPI